MKARAQKPVARDLPPSQLLDSFALAAVALLIRAVVARYAVLRFPPAADGAFYATIATRIAEGHGYTWVWDNGAVTYAAHYPIGYPAIVGAAYAVFGAGPMVPMALNALLGAVAAFAAHRLTLRSGSRGLALLGGLFVALHPSLVAYTPAFMTEGVTAALFIAAVALAARARDRGTMGSTALLGVVVGLATLVRPQSIVLAPLLAALAAYLGQGRRPLRIAGFAALATTTALIVCAPWTARNCVRMKQCALVSVNGGWNLLIGADAESSGSWSPIKVPAACREVFDEAKKDSCFGEQARIYIASHPGAWISLAPAKLAATFDHAAVAASYLHQSNGQEFSDAATKRLAITETIAQRCLVALALVAAGRRAPRGSRTRIQIHRALAAALVLLLFVWPDAWPTNVLLHHAPWLRPFVHAWPATVLLPLLVLLSARSRWRDPLLPASVALVVAATSITHVVFFGAARYGMVVFPLVAALAPLAFLRSAPVAAAEPLPTPPER